MPPPAIDPQKLSAELRHVVRKLMWWKPEEEALADPIRFASQVMTIGTWKDVQIVRAALGDKLFAEALRNPPPGVFDAPSWNYWHRVYKITPIPELPKRRLP